MIKHFKIKCMEPALGSYGTTIIYELVPSESTSSITVPGRLTREQAEKVVASYLEAISSHRWVVHREPSLRRAIQVLYEYSKGGVSCDDPDLAPAQRRVAKFLDRTHLV